MRQVKNKKTLRYNKCMNPKMYNNNTILTFSYDDKNRAITGQPEQLAVVLKRMQNEISVADFDKLINSES